MTALCLQLVVMSPLQLPTSMVNIGVGSGKPLQCPYLENPMDGGAWRAVVHGVTEESDTTECARTPTDTHTQLICIF